MLFLVSAMLLPLNPDVLRFCPAKFVAPAQPLKAEIVAAFAEAFAAAKAGVITDPATKPDMDSQYAFLACDSVFISYPDSLGWQKFKTDFNSFSMFSWFILSSSYLDRPVFSIFFRLNDDAESMPSISGDKEQPVVNVNNAKVVSAFVLYFMASLMLVVFIYKVFLVAFMLDCFSLFAYFFCVRY